MSLNPLQLGAAHAPVDHAHKIVAGAGTGKTSTMVERFVHLVEEHGLDPTRIVAVTFTNKAAAELRRRITAALVDREVITDSARLDTAWIGTFHTLCLRLLREHCYTVGFDRATTVIEPLAERLLVNDITDALLDGRVDGSGVEALEALDVDAVVRVVGETFDVIRRAKGRGLGPSALEQSCADGWTAWWDGGGGDAVTDALEAAAEREAVTLVCATYREYERRLSAARLIDFDGIVLRTLEALTDHDEWRARMREQFQYIIVDEYQDTSRSQAEVIRLLARAGMSNVAVVGDPRQSIYGWRDADIRNILQFAGVEHLLDVNYRSYQEILDLAGAVIGRDPLFADIATMAAHDEEGPRATPPGADPVVVTLAGDVEDEARSLAREVRALHDEQGVAWQEIAILTRLRNPPVAFEQQLRAAGVPYITSGGYGFYEREEIKDVVALLAVVENPLNDAAVVRVLQSPMARVADAELHAIVRRGAGTGHAGHVWDMVLAAETECFRELAAANASRACACLGLVRSLQADRAGLSVRELVQAAIDRGGAAARAAADASESDRRTGNLRKLVRLAAEYEATAVFSGIADFLRYIDLHERFAIDEPEADDVDADAVRFMTVHAAKGLEFPYVFFAYVSPARRVHSGFLFLDDRYGLVLRNCTGNPDDSATKFTAWTGPLGAQRPTDRNAEELRRATYVAITRGQRRVYVSATRRSQPAWEELAPLTPKFPDDDYFLTIATLARERGWPCRLAADTPAPGRRADGVEGGGSTAMPAALPLPPRAPREPAAPSRSRVEVSFTQVDVLAQCPLRYRYLFEWRIPAPPDDLWPDSARHQNAVRAGVLGDLVHRTLQACHPPGLVELDLARVHRAWAVAARGSLGDGDAEALWASDAESMFTHYLASPVARMATIATEQEFNLAVDVDGTPVMVRGFIDRLCRTGDGRVLVVDYKTNRDISSSTHAAHDRQLAIYRRAAAEALGYGDGVDACVLALRTGARVDGDPAAWQGVDALLRLLVSGERAAPASPPCRGCAFASGCPSSRVR